MAVDLSVVRSQFNLLRSIVQAIQSLRVFVGDLRLETRGK